MHVRRKCPAGFRGSCRDGELVNSQLLGQVSVLDAATNVRAVHVWNELFSQMLQFLFQCIYNSPATNGEFTVKGRDKINGQTNLKL